MPITLITNQIELSEYKIIEINCQAICYICVVTILKELQITKRLCSLCPIGHRPLGL